VERSRSAFLTGAGILLAVGLVAIAARGSTSFGDGAARRPSDTLIDILLSLYLVAMAAGAILFVYLLAIGRHSLSGRAGGQRRDWRNWIGVAVMVGALVFIANDLPERRFGSEVLLPPAPVGGVTQTGPAGEDAYEPEFAWIPVLVTLALVGLAVFAWIWSGRARRRVRGERWLNPLAEDIVRALDISLDDLRAEPDPRRAVIAAYARLEQVLAVSNLPRRPSEAPFEYLERMLASLEVSPPAARRLTDLFERAKFSHHELDAQMKEDAIAALERVRDDLLAAEALARQDAVAA